MLEIHAVSHGALYWLLSTPVGKNEKRSIPILPDALDHLGRLFFRNEGVRKYVPRVLIMYEEGCVFSCVGSAIFFLQWEEKMCLLLLVLNAIWQDRR